MSTSEITSLVVIGSRTFFDQSLLFHVCDELRSDRTVEVLSGGAKGADQLAELWARSRGLRLRVFLAHWSRFGRSAGFRRTAELLGSVSPLSAIVVCFVDKPLRLCRGSRFTVRLARSLGFRVRVVDAKYDFSDSSGSLFDVF